jgi:hypothetical protein
MIVQRLMIAIIIGALAVGFQDIWASTATIDPDVSVTAESPAVTAAAETETSIAQDQNSQETDRTKKKADKGGSLSSKEVAYAKAKAAVETIVADARKNPELRKTLEEASLKLKEIEKQQKEAQAILDAAITAYHKTKNDSNAAQEDIKAVKGPLEAAFGRVNKINDLLGKQRQNYEDLFGQTENTKQLRIREYKRVAGLNPIKEKALKSAERELSGLEAQMDTLLSSPKSKDKDITALETKIEEAQKLLDKAETEWEKTRKEVALRKLRSEIVAQRAIRERDRAQERLTALQEHANSKKGRKNSNDQDFKDEIDFLQKTLLAKEAALRAAQKAKDAQDLDVAAVGFDPDDPVDAETLEEERITPEERLEAKKNFHKILQDYVTAKKAVAMAEKDLIAGEKQYLDVKGQKRSKDKDIKTVTRSLKKLQFGLVRAIRVELKTKRLYEIALRRTETLKQHRLRILRELQALVKSLEKRFAEAKKVFAEAQAKLTKSQNAKPLDKKAVALATEEVDFAKVRFLRIKRDKDSAYKALKIAQKKAAIYGDTVKKKARKASRRSGVADTEEDSFAEDEYEEDDPLVYRDEYEEDDPLVYRDEDDEDLQQQEALEQENSNLEDAEEEADAAGKVVNDEIDTESKEAMDNPVSPGAFPSDDGQDDPIGKASRDPFDTSLGDQLDNGDQMPQNNTDADGYAIPLNNTGDFTGQNPDAGDPAPADDGLTDPHDDEAERQRLADAEEAKRIADQEAAAQQLADKAAANANQDADDPLPPAVDDGTGDGTGDDDGAGDPQQNPGGDTTPPDNSPADDASPTRRAIADARKADEAASRDLADAKAAGNPRSIINAQIAKERTGRSLAQMQIRQSPYGREILPQEKIDWATSYGKDFFDPQAPDEGGIFNEDPATSQDVTREVMEGSKLIDTQYVLQRPRVTVIERPGTSASTQKKLNEVFPNFEPDSGIEAL